MNESTKAKISAAKRLNHPMRWKHWPQEVREKLRASNIGSLIIIIV